MASHDVAIRRVTGRRWGRAAAEALVAAFLDDPGWRHLLPRLDDRRVVLASSLAALTLDAARRGGLAVAATGDDVAGAMVAWAPDGHPAAFTREYVRAAVTLATRAPLAAIPAALRWAAMRRSDVRSEPHWHLAALGVRPDAQRGGIGSRLLAEFLAQVDDAGSVAHLETTRRELVEWYGRFGFEVRHVIHLPRGRCAWTMRRDARGAPGAGSG